MGGVRPGLGEPGVSWALGLVEESSVGAGSSVGWWILMVGSIWWAVAGWVFLPRYSMMGREGGGLGGPLFFGRGGELNPGGGSWAGGGGRLAFRAVSSSGCWRSALRMSSL